mmetsp:Transcript_26370/g.68180  ORF Transcript_26370/g.68180 Transcript_26370/m.68180 type:complete len:230 (+) Transcript_26370:168-857(+)
MGVLPVISRGAGSADAPRSSLQMCGRPPTAALCKAVSPSVSAALTSAFNSNRTSTQAGSHNSAASISNVEPARSHEANTPVPASSENSVIRARSLSASLACMVSNKRSSTAVSTCRTTTSAPAVSAPYSAKISQHSGWSASSAWVYAVLPLLSLTFTPPGSKCSSCRSTSVSPDRAVCMAAVSPRRHPWCGSAFASSRAATTPRSPMATACSSGGSPSSRSPRSTLAPD